MCEEGNFSFISRVGDYCTWFQPFCREQTERNGQEREKQIRIEGVGRSFYWCESHWHPHAMTELFHYSTSVSRHLQILYSVLRFSRAFHLIKWLVSEVPLKINWTKIQSRVHSCLYSWNNIFCHMFVVHLVNWVVHSHRKKQRLCPKNRIIPFL